MIVAIDGPAGAGKSSLARALAGRIGAAYLDTGAMYRALTWLALREGADLDDAAGLAALAAGHPSRLTPGPDGPRVEIAGADVTAAIREPRVTAEVSRVATHTPVRAAMVDLQRALLGSGDWVADGRDIGTVVAPDAAVKVFLTASADERARRRGRDLARAGHAVAHEDLLRDIERRDAVDSGREASPLAVADGATVIDTTDMTPEQVIAALEALIEVAGG